MLKKNIYKAEKEFRTKAKRLGLKLPVFICSNGLEPFGKMETATFDLNFETIAIVINFIEQNFYPIQTINSKYTSYGLKHLIQNKIETYVSNSELIVAMLTCGYKYRQTHSFSPNCYFNVSQKLITRVEKMPRQDFLNYIDRSRKES